MLNQISMIMQNRFMEFIIKQWVWLPTKELIISCSKYSLVHLNMEIRSLVCPGTHAYT